MKLVFCGKFTVAYLRGYRLQRRQYTHRDHSTVLGRVVITGLGPKPPKCRDRLQIEGFRALCRSVRLLGVLQARGKCFRINCVDKKALGTPEVPAVTVLRRKIRQIPPSEHTVWCMGVYCDFGGFSQNEVPLAEPPALLRP